MPKINVYLPIYHGTSEEILSKGAGHLQNTSLPVGGASTHSVISAHSGYPGETFFDYLTDMKVGDEFYVHILDRTLKYEVDQIEVVLPSEINSLRIVDGEDLVTLLTCTPYGVNTHRLLVRGKHLHTMILNMLKQVCHLRNLTTVTYLSRLQNPLCSRNRYNCRLCCICCVCGCISAQA